MDLSKASEVYDFYLAEIEKAKYIKRTGSPGNYKYVYPGDEKKGRSGKKVVEKPVSKITNKQENGEKKMKVEIKGKSFDITKEEFETYDKMDVDSVLKHLENRENERNKMLFTSKRSSKEFAESLKAKYGEKGVDVIKGINKIIRSGHDLEKIPADIRESQNPLKFIMQAYDFFVGYR